MKERCFKRYTQGNGHNKFKFINHGLLAVLLDKFVTLFNRQVNSLVEFALTSLFSGNKSM